MKRNSRIGWLFASPWLLGFGALVLYPVFASLALSFTNYSILKSPRPIGLSNYNELIHDSVFWKSVLNTLEFAFGSVPLATVVAIGLALLLNTKVKGIGLYRTLFFIPSLVPMVALGVLWLWIFNGEYGVLNNGLKAAGLPHPNWLSDPVWTKPSLILISVWGCGQAMVIYLAGLQNVPVHLYEAADLDAANSWRKFVHITLPMISPVIQFNVIMGLIGALQVFSLPYVMFPGGQPARSTYMLAMYLYDNAFQFQRMGYASALAWCLFLITFALTVIGLKVGDRHVHYES